MSDQVGNPEDRFSHKEAQISISELRMHVYLNSKWEQKVQGLCDEFGQSSNGEYKPSTGGLTTSASEFAASWKVEKVCKDDYKPSDYKACVRMHFFLS